ncbi:MAG: hypothetical protein GY797_00475, partial [Deltaproteobacteria bacterium]|nr:hypothetical protein [Deltaproteobacteria bacterium]
MKQLRIGIVIFIAMLLAGISIQAQGAKLSWEPCETKVGDEDVTAECTTLSVPENRQDLASRQITITVMRIPTTGSAPSEPIFFLEGGPGKSNLKFNPSATLLERHDIVQVGYRGVNSSVVLDCPEFKDALKGQGNDLFSEESQANMATAMETCGQRLRQEGVDLNGYNILEVTEDI